MVTAWLYISSPARARGVVIQRGLTEKARRYREAIGRYCCAGLVVLSTGGGC